MRLPRFVYLRIAVLLASLVAIALVSAHQHICTRAWTQPLDVVIFPLDGDGQAATNEYIEALSEKDFEPVEAWGRREAARHSLTLEQPFDITLGPLVTRLPPTRAADASIFGDALWSLRFRFWAWRNTPDTDAAPHTLTRIRIFVVFHQGEDGRPLAHSLGMKKGLLGLVHAFARKEQNGQNNIVIAHELLHTVGASDKYGAGGTSRYPSGYAEAERQPRYPQRLAEIMSGRIPLSPTRSRMPNHLRHVIVNAWTAAEINWRDTAEPP